MSSTILYDFKDNGALVVCQNQKILAMLAIWLNEHGVPCIYQPNINEDTDFNNRCYHMYDSLSGEKNKICVYDLDRVIEKKWEYTILKESDFGAYVLFEYEQIGSHRIGPKYLWDRYDKERCPTKNMPQEEKDYYIVTNFEIICFCIILFLIIYGIHLFSIK